jgi:hypothetical protein
MEKLIFARITKYQCDVSLDIVDSPANIAPLKDAIIPRIGETVILPDAQYVVTEVIHEYRSSDDLNFGQNETKLRMVRVGMEIINPPTNEKKQKRLARRIT